MITDPFDIDDLFNRIDEIMSRGFYTKGSSEVYEDYSDSFLEDDEHIYFTYELPGAQEEDVSVEVEADKILLEYMGSGKWKHKKIPIVIDGIQKYVNPDTVEINIKNCILDIKMEKVGEIELRRDMQPTQREKSKKD